MFEGVCKNFELLFNHISDLAIVLDINKNILKVNKSVEDIVLKSGKDLYNKNIKEAFDNTKLSEFAKEVANCEELITASFNDVVIKKEYDCISVRICWKVTPIYNRTSKECKKDIILLLGTAFRHDEKEINKVKDYLENIISLLPGHVYWQDKNGVYLGCNDQQARSSGLKSRHEIANKRNIDLPWNVKSKSIVQEIEETNRKILQTGIAVTAEELAVFPNGEKKIYLSKKKPLRDEDGNIIGILGISFDITKRKEEELLLKVAKENAEASNQIKSDFIACMSHDLRTPLNGIFGAIQVLQMNEHSSEQEKFFLTIKNAADNLLYLVEDVLNFAKLEAGKVTLKYDAFDMGRLLEDVVSMFAHQANNKKLKLIVSYCDSVPRFVESDSSAIRRILINLIGNAIKFTDSGHILLSVDLVKRSSHDAIIQISVEDTGIGVPKDKIDFIFDRFTRVEPSYKGKYKGTGLGLTIAKKLSELLGGEIRVNSQLGCGSTFWCKLPFKLQKTPQMSSSWRENYLNVKVLIIDDYRIRAKNIHKQLGSNNNLYTISVNAFEVLKKAAKTDEPFQIVIVDDEISSCSPIDLANQIKSNSEFSNVMLVLFSSPGNIEKTQAEYDSGFFKRIIKPVQPKELTDELSDAWNNWLQMIRRKQAIKEERKKILLVEDDKIAQIVVNAMLEKLGRDVEIAETGEQAIKKAKSSKYELILMDIGLPDKDGLSVTREILKNRTKGNYAPIIGLTAHAFEKNKKECITAGMDGFLTKPVSFKDFENILSYIDTASIDSEEKHKNLVERINKLKENKRDIMKENEGN